MPTSNICLAPNICLALKDSVPCDSSFDQREKKKILGLIKLQFKSYAANLSNINSRGQPLKQQSVLTAELIEGSDLHGCLRGVLGLHSAGGCCWAPSSHSTLQSSGKCAPLDKYFMRCWTAYLPCLEKHQRLNITPDGLCTHISLSLPTRPFLAHFPKCIPCISKTVVD